MTGNRRFIYTLNFDEEDDFWIEEPKEESVCEHCGNRIPVGELYVYKSRSYHEKCLPEPAKEVATRVT